ncbi:40S ribosomal protein S24 isoform X2 [Pristis pectinata]|uniref:40S ribosomal protein S24 isoform X2 n=1 Tax=Pristis pectinata TaxID=685728 RepID=UPI00223E7818|nr:40S ribosomal protein S24 isoform X2 [Pristis pectinata]
MEDMVICCSCLTWELVDLAAVQDGHICSKCLRLDELRLRVDELELQLQTLRSIREGVSYVDMVHQVTVTPFRAGTSEVQDADRIVTVRGGKRKKKSGRQTEQGTLEAVPLSNRFSALEAVEGDDLQGPSCSYQVSGTGTGTAAQKGRVGKRRAVVIGDSKVRETDTRFCGSEHKSRMVCCLPGARVRDVTDRVHRILEREGEQPEVVVHVGTNDIGRKGDEVLKSEIRELGRRLRNRTSRVAILGLLPVPRDSEGRNRRRWQINAWLRSWCRREGFRFLDYWDLFSGRWDLYKEDGLHLNQKGANILAARFARVVREGLN